MTFRCYRCGNPNGRFVTPKGLQCPDCFDPELFRGTLSYYQAHRLKCQATREQALRLRLEKWQKRNGQDPSSD